MARVFNRRQIAVVAAVFVVVAAAVSTGRAVAATGGVIVSSQNDCTVGPTNDNHLSAGQTAYVWLILQSSTTSARGYTYEVTGTSNPFDSGILQIRFNQCRKVNTNDWVAKFTTPTVPGGYTLTV